MSDLRAGVSPRLGGFTIQVVEAGYSVEDKQTGECEVVPVDGAVIDHYRNVVYCTQETFDKIKEHFECS